MKTEKEKMLAGEYYNSQDPQLVAERLRARRLCLAINQMPPAEWEACQQERLDELLGRHENAYITPPFWCDYGSQIFLGKQVYFNFNCVVLDVAPVTVGDHVMVGPGVQLLTASHPLSAAERMTGKELGLPIVIEDRVWLGGNVVVCPGVRIGQGSVIGAGSVVTRDVPAGVFAAGNPCRVIRPLTP